MKVKVLQFFNDKLSEETAKEEGGEASSLFSSEFMQRLKAEKNVRVTKEEKAVHEVYKTLCTHSNVPLKPNGRRTSKWTPFL